MQGIADYRFLRPVVEGSRGSVYLAVPPPRLGLDCEHVGVKVVAGPTNEDSLRRATRELRAFASAQSPFLVKLLDAGQQDGTFFYSMEYCQLGSLAQPARTLSHAEIVVAVAQAARAAHSLHEAGLVHRSIKPANILLRDDGARLSDLGLVQTLSPGQTITGFGPVGDVEYVEPSILLALIRCLVARRNAAPCDHWRRHLWRAAGRRPAAVHPQGAQQPSALES
jgi:serine/threonine protein kinase